MLSQPSTLEIYNFSGNFSDITLRLTPENGPIHEFKAHRIILASKSYYFSTLFTGGFKEQFDTIIFLPSFFDPFAFDSLLHFFYDLELKVLTPTLLPSILEIADYLTLPNNVESSLLIAIRSIINIAVVQDLLSIYSALKKMMQKLPSNKINEDAMKAIEKACSINIKEIISQKLLINIPSETAINILETALYYVSENSTLKLILNELRILMKAPTIFQMLSYVLYYKY